jgi:hypothetical protein
VLVGQRFVQEFALDAIGGQRVHQGIGASSVELPLLERNPTLRARALAHKVDPREGAHVVGHSELINLLIRKMSQTVSPPDHGTSGNVGGATDAVRPAAETHQVVAARDDEVEAPEHAVEEQ